MRIQTYLMAAGCVALLVAPASAQVRAGLYDAQGTDTALGPYSGQVQLTDRGTYFDYVRFVRYQNPAPNGMSLATVWFGHAARQGNDLHLTVVLRRVDCSVIAVKPEGFESPILAG